MEQGFFRGFEGGELLLVDGFGALGFKGRRSAAGALWAPDSARLRARLKPRRGSAAKICRYA